MELKTFRVASNIKRLIRAVGIQMFLCSVLPSPSSLWGSGFVSHFTVENVPVSKYCAYEIAQIRAEDIRYTVYFMILSEEIRKYLNATAGGTKCSVKMFAISLCR